MGLMKLTMMQDLKLKELQRNAAADIVPGILPAVKQSMQEVKKDLVNILVKGLEEFEKILKEEGKTGMTPIFSCIFLLNIRCIFLHKTPCFEYFCTTNK